ncbi:MAG TPA: hypothetical protein VKS98_08375 [Chthoniobacterales bacterium]|nr:hypothetical protein [Chthoniobacterales bacterium]
MKKVLALFVIALAAAFYMGYSPVDFIPSFQASSAPPPKVRRAQPPAEQAQNAAPAPRTGGSTVIAGTSDDGSLEHRWKAFPNSSPTKP